MKDARVKSWSILFIDTAVAFSVAIFNGSYFSKVLVDTICA
ncbi:hypothetical protein [Leuconostoc suionicum]|nr:hypothetical protein [Leuconostoc suionicum]MDC2806896.1 hypothetical protein [Leuconostoc suionicum]MDC2824408.1 hypothetical protein [Leuconostoc suionicum]